MDMVAGVSFKESTGFNNIVKNERNMKNFMENVKKFEFI
jgi:hypothetical protein